MAAVTGPAKFREVSWSVVSGRSWMFVPIDSSTPLDRNTLLEPVQCFDNARYPNRDFLLSAWQGGDPYGAGSPILFP